MNAPLRIRAGQTTLEANSDSTSTSDDYLTRLVKLVPAEVIALYLSFKASAESIDHLPLWGFICLLLVILVRTVGTKQTGKPFQLIAVLVAVISFILWIYGIGQKIWPLDFAFGWLSGAFSSISIGVWTFVVPYFYKGD